MCQRCDWLREAFGNSCHPIVPGNISALDSHDCIQHPFWNFFGGRGGPLGDESQGQRGLGGKVCFTQSVKNTFEVLHPVWVPHHTHLELTSLGSEA